MLSERRIQLKPNSSVTPCPRCSNNTRFTAVSERVAEDCCEVFLICECGRETPPDDRLEDVWGSLDQPTVTVAISCWNDSIRQGDSGPAPAAQESGQ